MGAAIYTPEEEARYRLPPLPEIPFMGVEEAQTLRWRYEHARAEHRHLHPIIDPRKS